MKTSTTNSALTSRSKNATSKRLSTAATKSVKKSETSQTLHNASNDEPTVRKRVAKSTTSKTGSDSEQRRVGRPRGSGKYGESTKAVRFPVSLLDKVDSIVERRGFVFPLYSERIQAGFPSPAEEDSPFEPFDLGAKLIPNPTATFFIRVAGESMRDAGIFPGDVLIVDRSLEAMNGDVVVAVVDGEFTVKRLFRSNGRLELRPENKSFRPIVINEETELTIWGVVKTVIHNV